MAYVSLYRKYRSQTFDDLIGQDHVIRTLQNGIASGRIAHAYLFTGPRGTGKTSTARLLAKALCCVNGPTPNPCNDCDICKSIAEGNFIDVIEMDAASQTGIDDVREKIIQAAEYMPAIARYKVFIIDEVHDLSTKAFDALLKTIEEPPAHIIFVLATTEYNKVPPTIRSRCQKFEFHRGSLSDLKGRIELVAKSEGVEFEPDAITAIARMADGGFRDALSLMEQAIISSEGKIALINVYDQLGLVAEEVSDRILTAMNNCDIAELTNVLNELTRLGRDPRAILESLLYRLADITRIVFKVDGGASGDASLQAASHELAVRVGQRKILEIRGALTEAHKSIRDISLPRLWLESELVRVSQLIQDEAQPAPAVTNGVQETVKPLQKPPAAKPEEAPAPKPAADNPATELWEKALAAMPPSTPISMRLTDSRAQSLEKHLLVVEVDRKVDLDWMQDPKHGRMGYVLKLLRAVGGENLNLELRLAKSAGRRIETVAVELPAEGPKLAQLADEVFGS